MIMPAPKGHAPYPGCETGGRPIKYTLEYVNELADNLLFWISDHKDNLFIEDWCLENDIPEEAISTDLTSFEKFSKAYNKLKTKQKVEIFKGGLKRKFAHNMCALLLSHSHNIHLKTEQKLTGSATDPLEFLLTKVDGKTKDLVEHEQCELLEYKQTNE